MYPYYKVDKNATTEMREQIFQSIKGKLKKLRAVAQKESDLNVLSDIDNTLSSLLNPPSGSNSITTKNK